MEIEARQHKRVELKRIKGPDKIEQLLQRAAKHPNAVVRWLFGTLHIVWTFVAMVVGALIAMVIAVAAG